MPDPNEPMDPQDLQEVRKIIEKSTSKVSLRDLEKKGFRKVKVLRSNDIDELIRRAVHAVVAREGVGDSADNERLVEKAKEELKQLMAQAQAGEQERAELAEEKEELELQLRELRAKAAARVDLEGKLKELQRRLADEEERRHRAEAQLGTADVTAAARTEELERRADEAEELAAAAGRKIADIDRQRQERERELDGMRRRLEEAEARAVALSGHRDEADTLRSRARQLETEARLTQELELPKLRSRIAELEAEVRAARAHPAPAGPGMGDMRAMFKELLQEVGAGHGSDPTIKEEFAKMQRSIAESLARAGGRGTGELTQADFDAARVSLEALFTHDEASRGVVSNIGDVTMKESTTTGSDVKSKLDKLKALRKGGSS
jgi:chromosome segregation ATPase